MTNRDIVKGFLHELVDSLSDSDLESVNTYLALEVDSSLSEDACRKIHDGVEKGAIFTCGYLKGTCWSLFGDCSNLDKPKCCLERYNRFLNMKVN